MVDKQLIQELKGTKYLLLSLGVVIAITQAAAASNFTIAVLPDTQKYTEQNPSIFSNQTKWITRHDAENKRDIEYVIHLGDLVEHWNNRNEWQRANNSIQFLENNTVPYGVLPGNHDIGYNEGSLNTTQYETFFGYDKYKDKPWYGGSLDKKNLVHYDLIEPEGHKLGIMYFRYYWDRTKFPFEYADRIIKSHPNRDWIVVSHCFKDTDGAYYCGSDYVSTNTSVGYDLVRLADRNENLKMVMAGHQTTEYYQNKRYKDRNFHQIVSDYQKRRNSGNGWMRLYEFRLENNVVQANTYSPYLGRFENDTSSKFTMQWNGGKKSSSILISSEIQPRKCNTIDWFIECSVIRFKRWFRNQFPTITNRIS